MNGAIIGRLCGVGLLVLTATGPSSGVTLFHRPIVRVGANLQPGQTLFVNAGNHMT